MLENYGAIVSGPFSLTSGPLIVYEPKIALLLKNGVVDRVLLPGKHSKWTDVPIRGELKYLLFDPTPFDLTLTMAGVRTMDGGKVDLEVDVHVEPVWTARPDTLRGVLRRYGPDSAKYAKYLIDSLVTSATSSIQTLTASTSYSELMRREYFLGLLRRGSLGNDDFSIVGVSDYRSTEDPLTQHLERLHFERAAETATIQNEFSMEPLRNSLESFRLQNRLAGERLGRLSAAETDQALAQIYGVPAWALSQPEMYRDFRMVQLETMKGMLTEYADVLPILSREMGVSAGDVVRGLLQMSFESSTAEHASSRPEDDIVAELRTLNPLLDRCVSIGLGGFETTEGTCLIVLGFAQGHETELSPVAVDSSRFSARGVSEIRATVVIAPSQPTARSLVMGSVLGTLDAASESAAWVAALNGWN
jgi:hypothetical protein